MRTKRWLLFAGTVNRRFASEYWAIASNRSNLQDCVGNERLEEIELEGVALRMGGRELGPSWLLPRFG
jgi:hypothetical protein